MRIKDLLPIGRKRDKDKNKVSFKLPLKDIKDIITGDNGTYKLVAKVSPINGDLAPDDMLEEIAEAMQGALNSFEGRQGIYILSEKIDISENIKNIEKRKLELDSEIKIHILDENKKTLESLSNRTRTILNFYITLEIDEKNYNVAEQTLLDAYKSIKTELEAGDMYTDQMTEHETKQMLYEKMNPEQSQIEKYNPEWFIENLYPQNSTIYEDGIHLGIENKLYKFYAITFIPTNVDKFRWLRKLYSVNGDISIAITLKPKNKGKILKELSSAVDEAGGRALNARSEATKQEYEKEEESAKNIIAELGNDNVSLYDANITIGISAKTMDDLNTLGNSVQSKVNASYLQSTELRRKDFDPFYTILPILADNNITENYVWNLTTKDIASIIPFDSSEYMESDGTLIGFNETSRGLVIANTRSKIYNNGHLCIVADSGSGKTYLILTQVIRNIPYVDYTILFDNKGDLALPYGKSYSISATGDIIVNPFHIRNAMIDSENENDMGKINVGIFLSQKIMDLMVFFKWIIPTMTPYDESLLEECIRKTYEKCEINFESVELPEEFCTMSTLDEVMEISIENSNIDLERERLTYIKTCLRPYVVGTYSKIFNGQTNWDFSYLTRFDISNVPDAVKKPLYDILLKDTWQFSKKDGVVNPTTKDIYVDEAHIFADENNPQTLEFISVKLAKQGRGFGIRLITATQNLPDFLSIKRHGQAIIDNSYFKLFMKMGDNDIPVAKKLYNFSDTELKVLKGSGNKRKGAKGKGVFIIGSQRVLIQSWASKFELEMIDPIQYEDIYGKPSRYLNRNQAKEA